MTNRTGHRFITKLIAHRFYYVCKFVQRCTELVCDTQRAFTQFIAGSDRTAIGIELFSVGIISQRSSVVFVFVTNMQPHTHTTKAIENRAEAKRNQNAADSSFSFLCVVSLVDFFVHSV